MSTDRVGARNTVACVPKLGQKLMTQTQQPPQRARARRIREQLATSSPGTEPTDPIDLEDFPSSGSFEDLDREQPSWTDPRFLVPLALFLSAVFVIGLALRANNRVDEPTATVDQLVLDVSAAQARAGFEGVTVRRDGDLIVLEGQAQTSADATAIGAVARSVEGVTSVDNRLVVVAGTVESAPTSSVTPSEPVRPPATDKPLAERLADAGRITFETGSADITTEGFAVVDVIAPMLAENATLPLEVHGHTDSDGDSTDNERLSQERAQAVVNALIARGIAPERLTAVGFGESQPIEPNITAEGRAANRRIEFVLRP